MIDTRIRRWAAAKFAIALLLAADLAMAQTLPPPDATVCTMANGSPVASGSTPTAPGRWWNPNRSGSGWDLAYAANGDLIVTWFTYDALRRPVWLTTSLAPISNAVWSSRLYRKRLVSGAVVNDPAAGVGDLTIRFLPNDPTRAAIRWRWNDVNQGASIFEECITDFFRPGTISGFQLDANGRTTSFTGPTSINSGLVGPWDVPPTGGWSVSVAVNQVLNTNPPEYIESYAALIYDTTGYPVWVQGILDAGQAPQVPLEMEQARTVDLKYASSSFPSAYPIDHCPQGCAQLATAPVGRLTRWFTQEVNPSPRIVLNVELRVGTPTPTSWPVTGMPITGQSIDWTRPSGGGSVALERQYGLRTDWVLVDRYQCGIQPDQPFCNVVLNWSSSLASARVFRRNLVTNQLSATSIGQEPRGQSLQELRIGERVQYELHSSTSPTPATLLFRTPEVRALSIAATTPPQPDATVAPPLNATSDSVGATEAQFRVDESGAATYRIPVLVPPGRGGLAPQVGLSYSSAAGDGSLGIGWSLDGYSMITRCRRSRESGDGSSYQWSGIGVHSDIAFCLDGQRLIQIPNGVATGAAGAEYRTEIDTFQRVVVESSDTTTLDGQGPSHQPLVWAVYGKDGTVRRFGEESGLDGRRRGRSAPPGAIVDVTMGWAETTRRDTVGNLITFDHERIEISSLPHLGAAYDHYLSEIRFIGGRVQFKYIDRPVGSAGSAPYDRQVQGRATLASRSRRLSSIEVFADRCTTNPASGAAPNCTGIVETIPFRTYALAYGPTPLNPSRERLRSVQECGKNGVCFAPTEFTWAQPSATQISSGLVQFGESEAVGRFGNLSSMKYGDFNGDGRTDIYWTDSEVAGRTLKIAVSTGDGARFLFTPVQGTGVTVSGKGIVDRNWHILDFNGDGLDDVVYIPEGGSGWTVRLAQPVTGWPGNMAPAPSPGTPPSSFTSAFALPPQSIINGGSLGATVPLFGTSDLAHGGILADANGDGLLDLLTPSGPESGGFGLRVRFMERRPTLIGAPFAFSSLPVPIKLENTYSGTCAAALFDDWNIQRFEAQDYNGDGVADLRLRTTPQSCRNDGRSAPSESDSQTATTSPPTGELLNTAEYYWTLFTNHGLSGGFLVLKASAATSRWRISKTWLDSYSAPQVDDDPEAFQVADINADGFTDVLFRKPDSSEWVFQLNLGGFFSPSAAGCVVPSSGVPTESDALIRNTCLAPQQVTRPGMRQGHQKFTMLSDLDEDGRLDFWFTENASPNRQYWVLPWIGSRFAAPTGAIATGFAPRGSETSDSEDVWLRASIDMDGDGAIDFLQLRPKLDGGGPHGAWQLQRMAPEVRAQPRNAITGFRNGVGAETLVGFLPLTVSDVYRRDFDGPYRGAWGRGSPVFDVSSPNWVVSVVQSSAPTEGDATGRSQIEYRYQGLKVQSGGRGSLGFRRILTFDVQSGVETVTTYRQDFPFIGVPIGTVTRRALSGQISSCAPNGASEVNAAQCFSAAPRCASGASATCDTVWEEGRSLVPLTFSSDAWGYRYSAPAAFAPVNADDPPPPPVATTAAASTPTLEHRPIGLFKLSATMRSNAWESSPLPAAQSELSRVESTMVTDDYGNLVKSTKTIFEGNSTNVIHRKTAAFFYSYSPFISGVGTAQASDDRWLLGRLVRTRSVEERRRGAGLVPGAARWATFSYDTSTGLLVWERTQDASPSGSFASARYSTHHQYDGFGNRIQSSVCTPDIGEAACAATSVSTVAMVPASNTRVHRYTRWVFDALGRFPVAELKPYFGPSNSTIERSAESTRSWNELGQPSVIEAINGETTTITYGSMLREWFRKSNLGPWTQTTYARCTAPAQPPFCPAHAAVRVESSSGGSATTWNYVDVLERSQLLLRQLDATRFVAVRSHYDWLGRNVKTSEPYLAVGPGFAGAGNASQVVAWTTTSFDGLGRPLSITRPDGGVISFTRTGLETVQTLPANGSSQIQSMKELRDAAGSLIATTDANNWTQHFEYAPTGELAEVRRTLPGGVSATTTSMSYDELGFRIGMVDPDAGSYTYIVNAIGEVIEESAANVCTRTTRDAQGRMVARRDFNGPCGASLSQYSTWTWDTAQNGLGQLQQEASSRSEPPNDLSTQIVARGFGYDNRGRLNRVLTVASSPVFDEMITYDAFSRPFQRFYKAQLTGFKQIGEQMTYDAYGRISRVTDAYPSVLIPVPVEFYRLTDVSVRGQAARVRYGDIFDVARTFQPSTGRVTSIVADGGRLQNHSYQYDLIGNVRERIDNPSALDIDPAAAQQGTDAPVVPRYVREVFEYDRMQRLTRQDVFNTVGPSAPATDTFEYDGGVNIGGPGNLTRRQAHGPYGYGARGSACTLPSEAIPGPHALVSASVMGGSTQYCYDARGNQTRAVVGGVTAREVTYTPYNLPASIRSPQAGRRSNFLYGPNRELVVRQDYGINDPDNSPRQTTFYIGSTEFHVFHDTNRRAVKRRVPEAGGLFRQQESFFVAGFSATVHQEGSAQYILTDALGSTHAVVAGDRRTVGRTNGERLRATQSFNPWGFRRTVNGQQLLPWATVYGLEYREHTRDGFTGHESLDFAGLIHMGGRVYDPATGRFLNPDPVVQAPHDGQNYNRYTYAFNNPLAYTDPTGHWSRRHQQYLRTAVAIAITAYTGGVLASINQAGAASFFGVNVTSANVLAVKMVGGFASGAVQSGDLKGGLAGAFSAGMFHGIGSLPDGLGKIVAHGVGGGIMAELQGGKFGHGFVSAGVTEALSPTLMEMNPGAFEQTAVAAVVGGTASALSGGKFANGAVTAAFQMAFNHGSEAVTGRGKWRRLTTGEIQDAEGEGLKIKNVGKVRVYRKGFSGFEADVIAPNGNVYVGSKQTMLPWSEDYSRENIEVRGQFIHELVHVYQTRSLGCSVICMGLSRAKNSEYDYSLQVGKSFSDYGIEQQATMVQDRFLLRNGASASSATPGTVDQLNSTIPF